MKFLPADVRRAPAIHHVNGRNICAVTGLERRDDRIIFPLLMPMAGFITRNVDYSIQHYGLDISAPEGESIVAPAPGEVVFEDWTLTGGNTLIIVTPMIS